MLLFFIIVMIYQGGSNLGNPLPSCLIRVSAMHLDRLADACRCSPWLLVRRPASCLGSSQVPVPCDKVCDMRIEGAIYYILYMFIYFTEVIYIYNIYMSFTNVSSCFWCHRPWKISHVSSDQIPNYLLYRGESTTQLYGDCNNKPL